MNTPALTSTPPESARMGHAHSPVTTWTVKKERNPALGQGAGIGERQ